MSLDRLHLCSLGVTMAVSVAEPAMRARIADLYSACLVTPASDRVVGLELEVRSAVGGFELRAGGNLCMQSTVSDDVIEWLAWKVNAAALEHDREELVLHAAAAARGGRGVLVTGPSGAGKSTMVAALVLGGFAYMGDDSVVVDGRSGEIRSNPKPIALDGPSIRALLAMSSDNDELRAARRVVSAVGLGEVRHEGSACAVDLIVHARHRPGCATTVTALGAAGAAELLADQSFNFSKLGSTGLASVARITRRARAVVVEFSSVADAVRIISEMFDASTADPASPTVGDAAYRHSRFDVEIISGEALVWDPVARELHHLDARAPRFGTSVTTRLIPARSPPGSRRLPGFPRRTCAGMSCAGMSSGVSMSSRYRVAVGAPFARVVPIRVVRAAPVAVPTLRSGSCRHRGMANSRE